jgi:uncharacterized protein (DUF433 family)
MHDTTRKNLLAPFDVSIFFKPNIVRRRLYDLGVESQHSISKVMRLIFETRMKLQDEINYNVLDIANYLVDSALEHSVYAKCDYQGELLKIIRDDDLNVFVTFPKQISGKIVLSEESLFYPLISTQKGDWFQAQDLNFRDLQAAVQNDLKTGFRTVRLEFSIIETEIKHTPGVCGGDARIRNTRIPVWTLVSLRQQGATDSDLLDAYPSLIQSDLEAAWKYYQHHQGEIDQAIASQDDD